MRVISTSGVSPISERIAGGLPCVGMVAVEAAVISNETFCQSNRLTHLECPRSGAGSRLRIRDCAYSFETTTNDLSSHRYLHRGREHDRDRHFHQSRISNRRFANRIFRDGGVGGRWRVRDVRCVRLCGTWRCIAAFGWRIQFFQPHLSSVGWFSRGMDFGDGWFCRAGCDRSETVRHLFRGYFSGNERAFFVASGRLDHHVRFAARFAVGQLFSKRVYHSQSCADRCHHRRRIYRQRHAAGFVFARAKAMAR